MLYLSLKTLHILSVVIFLGNVITGVFWKRHADRSGDLRMRAQAAEGLIRSDRWFTLPGVVLIIASGVALALVGKLPILGTGWILGSLLLFLVSGAAFQFRVEPLQKKLLANTRAGLAGSWDETEYRALSRQWDIWGAVATGAPLLALVLMVLKPGG